MAYILITILIENGHNSRCVTYIAPINCSKHYQMSFCLSRVSDMKKHVGQTAQLLQIYHNDVEEKQVYSLMESKFFFQWKVILKSLGVQVTNLHYLLHDIARISSYCSTCSIALSLVLTHVPGRLESMYLAHAWNWFMWESHMLCENVESCMIISLLNTLNTWGTKCEHHVCLKL